MAINSLSGKGFYPKDLIIPETLPFIISSYQYTGINLGLLLRVEEGDIIIDQCVTLGLTV